MQLHFFEMNGIVAALESCSKWNWNHSYLLVIKKETRIAGKPKAVFFSERTYHRLEQLNSTKWQRYKEQLQVSRMTTFESPTTLST